MQAADNTTRTSTRQARSPFVRGENAKKAGKQFGEVCTSNAASAGASKADKAFAAQGLKYASGGLAFSAGDAANAIVAVNGGPISGKQLDALLKSGFVKIDKGSWSLDLRKLDGDRSVQLVGNILHGSSLNGTQRYRLLGHSIS